MRHSLGVTLAAAAAVLAASGAGAETRQVTEQGITCTIVDEHAIPQPLTSEPGDPLRGREVFVGRRLGNWLACHHVTALEEEPYHGNVGPTLDGVADRLSDAGMRPRVVEPKVVDPVTIMPAFFRSTGLHDVREPFVGTILTAQQVEDVIAFLKPLKE
jgi:sulfur-oxidizing protein SoxX